MNFREHFEQWHLKRYGYKAEGKGTALNYTYKQPTIQQRWEGWQACAAMFNDHNVWDEEVGERIRARGTK
jgi:hypothetical protein